MLNMLAAKNLTAGARNKFVPRTRRLDSEHGAQLPESYKKFFVEWKYTKPKPVHYFEEKGKYKLNKHGEVEHVVNLPIRVSYVKEQDLGIWGGEWVIKGYRRPSTPYEVNVPNFWVPRLLDHIVYSEILDKYMNMTVTQRTIDLIHENYGFDNYILRTKACDLVSLLACKLKRKMLLALYHKTLYPNDEKQREEMYEKYKHFLEGLSEQDIEWYGWSFEEAVRKNQKLERQRSEDSKAPLKVELRAALIEQLKQMKMDGSLDKDNKKLSLLQKFNPFAKVQE